MANIQLETKVEGGMICGIHHLTMVHIIYTILRGRISGPISGIAFSNWLWLGTGRIPHLVGGAVGVTML